MNKHSRLLALAKRRQRERWLGYKSLVDYHGGSYECDFVSPFTKTAGNVNADVMVLLQDWSSDDELTQGLDENTQRLGHDPTQPTGRNLEQFLNTNFGLSLRDTYGTNLFPFIKRGAVSSHIPERDLIKAALAFALPQIEIVGPRLVICLGLVTFDALRRSRGLPRSGGMNLAINSPFHIGESRVWCQAHTGAFGQMNRNRGDANRAARDWMTMKEDFMRG